MCDKIRIKPETQIIIVDRIRHRVYLGLMQFFSSTNVRVLTMRTDTSSLSTPPVCEVCMARITKGQQYFSLNITAGESDVYGRVSTPTMPRQSHYHVECAGQ